MHVTAQTKMKLIPASAPDEPSAETMRSQEPQRWPLFRHTWLKSAARFWKVVVRAKIAMPRAKGRRGERAEPKTEWSKKAAARTVFSTISHWNNISSSQVFGPHPLQQPALKDFKVSNDCGKLSGVANRPRKRSSCHAWGRHLSRSHSQPQDPTCKPIVSLAVPFEFALGHQVLVKLLALSNFQARRNFGTWCFVSHRTTFGQLLLFTCFKI